MAARFRWDDFVLDLDAYRLVRGDRPLSLEPKAFDLLALMIERPQHLFTKQEIFDALWRGTAVTDHALTRVVAQLRKVLGDEAREPKYIETVPSKGYRWIAAVDVEAARPQAAAVKAAREPTDLSAGPAPVQQARHRQSLVAAAALAMLGLGLFGWAQGDLTSVSRRAPSATEGASDGGPHGGSPRWPVQFTTHAGLDVHPALSPLGDAMAYASDRSGAFEIYVRAFGGASRETAITSDAGHNVEPAWSPDGRFLAYHSACKGGIWVVPARGGTARQVAATGSRPSWSPDGRRIAFQSDEQLVVTPTAYGAQHGSTIWTVDPEGGNATELTHAGRPIGGHAAPAWSRDGRYLAFTVFEGGPDNGIWILRLDSGETQALIRGGGYFEVLFAPDGSAVYATSGEAAIVRFPFDSATGTRRGARELIPIAGVPGVRGLSISPDGSRVAFAGIALSSQIWGQAVARDGTASGSAYALTNDTSRRNSVPTISPDGTKVAYRSKRSGELSNVWMMDADGRNSLQLTSDDSDEGPPRWLPDNRRVAYLSYRRSTIGIWTVDIETRREERLFDLERLKSAASTTGLARNRVAEIELAPSVTRAAFSVISRSSGRRNIYVTLLDPFVPRAVTDGSAWVGYPAWSPDERQLAVEIKDGSSMHAGVIDLETGALRRLTNERGQTWPSSWSPDGRKIAAAALRDGVWDLRWIDAATGEQQRITPAASPNVYVRYPEWSPRGDLIVFERGEMRGNLWTLDVRY